MIEGRRIHVRGLVQGVGFRPFVWHVATELELSGWVRNDASGVEIAAEGDPARIRELVARLHREAPSHARIDAIRVDPVPARGERGFVIVASATADAPDTARIDSAPGAARIAIGPDTGVCAQCLEELFDPASRRWRHPFITCTHCGPRFTLTHGLPYDRGRTSMAAFPMCAACAREYADPRDRRFHAEPVCCPDCGPRLRLHDGKGNVQVGDPLANALASLRGGAIVAIKGLGGFHLACDARNPQAVARLRARKERERKPFAVMGASVASFRDIARIDDVERALLESDERPVVLCRYPGGATGSPSPAEAGEGGGEGLKNGIADGIAPGLQTIGLMLPSTPIQWLLFHEAAGRPAGTGWLHMPQELLLVMTSANPGGEPLVADNDEAAERLAGDPPIADAILDHDRGIAVRCDDSVRSARGFVRRARGFVPQPIRLPRSGPSVLAFGGWYKNTVCATRGDEAYVSQHIGDLDNAATVRVLERTVEHLLGILDVAPTAVACDLHPDFPSSLLAAGFAERNGIALIPVQHHHAHIAAVLAEHGREEEDALGLAVDGVGLGTDGGAWGGELLRLHGVRCDRIGHLAPLGLPGGDRAAREPWRMAAAALHRMGRGGEIAHRFAAQPGAQTIADMLARGLHSPPTSSLGRVFDAAAALLGVCENAAYEGEAAMRLEGLAGTRMPAARPHAGAGDFWRIDPDGTLDLLPLLAYLADCRDPARGAAVFHAALARALADWVIRAAERTGVTLVAGGGGCLLNSLLGAALRAHLQEGGLSFLEARQLPPNDGGVSLGQAWVAMQTVGR